MCKPTLYRTPKIICKFVTSGPPTLYRTPKILRVCKLCCKCLCVRVHLPIAEHNTKHNCWSTCRKTAALHQLQLLPLQGQLLPHDPTSGKPSTSDSAYPQTLRLLSNCLPALESNLSLEHWHVGKCKDHRTDHRNCSTATPANLHCNQHSMQPLEGSQSLDGLRGP